MQGQSGLPSPAPNAPSTASYTGTVASLLRSRRLHTMTTLSRPPDSSVHPSGDRLSDATAEKWPLSTAGHAKQRERPEAHTQANSSDISPGAPAVHDLVSRSHTRTSASSPALTSISWLGWNNTRSTVPLHGRQRGKRNSLGLERWRAARAQRHSALAMWHRSAQAPPHGGQGGDRAVPTPTWSTSCASLTCAQQRHGCSSRHLRPTPAPSGRRCPWPACCQRRAPQCRRPGHGGP